MGEHPHHQRGAALAQQEDNSRGEGAQQRRKREGAQHAVVLLRAVVVADNRLHALVEAHDNHRKDEHQSVDNAIRGDGYIAAVAFELVVDDDDHEAMCQIGQERGHSYRQSLPRDILIQPPDTAVDMD